MGTCFLSYGRKDDEAFVERLRAHLEQEKDIRVWWDRTSMESRGMPFLRVIDDAIRSVDRVVFVVGPEALASDYVQHELRVADESCKIVVHVLRASDLEALPPRVTSTHVYDFRRADLSALTDTEQHAFQALLRELRAPVVGPAQLSGFPALPRQLNPRRAEVDRVLDLLLADNLQPLVVTSALGPTAVMGMGGIGKSVLAGLVARSCRARRVFLGGIFFKRCAEEDSPRVILDDLIRLLGELPPSGENVESSSSALSRILRSRPCLLILDNVWTKEQVAAVVNCADRSEARVLLTTRIRDVAKGLSHQRFDVQQLSPEDSRAHLAAWVGLEPRTLPAEAAVIVRICGGLPLALSICGALLAESHYSWDSLATELESCDLGTLSVQMQNYEHAGVLAAMGVSFAALCKRSPALAGRYRLLATFGTSDSVPFEIVCALWQANDEPAIRQARRDLHALHEASLLTLTEDTGHVLHDLQRAFLLSTGPGESTLRRQFLELVTRGEAPLAVAARSTWLRRHWVEYLLSAGDWNALDELLKQETDRGDNAWFALRTMNAELDRYAQDLDRISVAASTLPPDSRVRWAVRETLIRASLTNRARNTPWQLVCAAVKHGFWSTTLAKAGLRLSRSADRALGLAGLVPFHAPADRERILKEFFDALGDCDDGAQCRALEVFRRSLVSDADRALGRSHAKALLAREYVSVPVLAELVELLVPEDLSFLLERFEAAHPEARAVLVRLMPFELAREMLATLVNDESLDQQLTVCALACRGRPLLSTRELSELTGAVLEQPAVHRSRRLLKLLETASSETVEELGELLPHEAWTKLTKGLGPLELSRMLPEWTGTRFAPELEELARDTSPSVYGTASLAGLARDAPLASKAAALEEIEGRLQNELDESARREDFGWLPDVMGQLAKVWNEISAASRARILAGIRRVGRRFRAKAILPLFPLDSSVATELSLELLESVRYAQAWFDVHEPLADLAPALDRKQVEIALGMAQCGRDAGFEQAYAANLWAQLDSEGLNRAYDWVLRQAELHLMSRETTSEWQFAEGVCQLVNLAPVLATESVALVRRLAQQIEEPRHAALVSACLASWSASAVRDADWKSAREHAERLSDDRARGETFARLASFGGPDAERFREQALGIEASLGDSLERRDSWLPRTNILSALPDGDETSRRALELLSEIFDDKLDTYLPRLARRCPIDGLLEFLGGELTLAYRELNAEASAAVVARCVAADRLDTALRVAGQTKNSDPAIEHLGPKLLLHQARELLEKKPRHPALFECLARHGHLTEALGFARRLTGSERFVAVARCCRHATDAEIVEPMRDAVSDFGGTEPREALEVAAPVLARLPEHERLRACLSILGVISELTRQQAIPCVYVLSPLLHSFERRGPAFAARQTLEAIIEATRWWPVYPRS